MYLNTVFKYNVFKYCPALATCVSFKNIYFKNTIENLLILFTMKNMIVMHVEIQ